VARKHRRFIEDLKIGPYGRLDGVGARLTLKRAMSNQFAGSQRRQQMAALVGAHLPPRMLVTACSVR
jgi:hypothetical protein